MPVVPAPADEEIPRIEIAFGPEVSMETPGVKRTISWKSLMPFLSIVSSLMAVMLMGTLLMLSSRRVAVTTISSSAPEAAGVPVSDAFASFACAAAARAKLAPPKVPKNNKYRKTGAVIAFESVVRIMVPADLLYGQITRLCKDSSIAVKHAQPSRI